MPSLPPYQQTNTERLGLPGRFLRWVEEVRAILAPVPNFYKDSGSPEGVVTAEQGSYYFRTDGSAGTYVYVKTTTTGNSGWQAIG